MAKPTILAVDDDPQVLNAVYSDLRRRFADRYRIVRANGGEAALEALREIQSRGDAVALILSDQRMPDMSGVELLEQAKGLFPEARRVLFCSDDGVEEADD